LVTDFDDLPRVKNALLDQALYQIVRVSLVLNDLASATNAMRKILDGFPDSTYRDRSLLLVGQSFTLADQPAEARALFTDLAKRMPDSPLLPEVELAVARSYLQERNWTAAIAQYEQWIARFATNDLRPEAEFHRAWANDRADRGTIALMLFTNFVAQYPNSVNAPAAQFWVGNYFFNQKDFVNAEKSFQDRILLQNSNFTHHARMMAGRAAFARQSWKDASDYFTSVVNDPSCPTNLLAEAFFALGDTFTRQEANPAKPLQKFDEALKTFSKISLNTPSSPLVPAAWGRIGDCYLQLAAQDLKQYDNATNAYWQAMTSRGAEVKVRYQAEVGLAQTLEKMARLKQPPDGALLKDAFDHYYNLVRDKALREGEKADPFWFEKAGLAAGRLAEELNQWEVAVNIYSRLLQVLPQLRATLEKKIEKASEQLRPQKG